MVDGQVSGKGISFSIEGMTCASCVRIVERSLAKIEGVSYVSVNLATGRGYVLAENDIPFETIKKAVTSAGYTASEKISDNPIELEMRRSRMTLLVALILTLPLAVIMALHMAGIHIPFYTLIEVSAGAPVLFVAGRRSFAGAWIALRHRHTNMDTLISLGALSAWTTGILNLAGLNILSFAAIAPMLVTLHVAGRYIEAGLKHKAARDIRSLAASIPPTALVLSHGGPVETDIDAIRPGDTLLIRTGDRIALDGTVLSGSGTCDESMVTGESLPVHRMEGDPLTGGTILLSGNLTMSVDRVGEDTFLGGMVRLVREAQASRVPIQAMADRATRFFIPVVFLLAVTSSVLWYMFFDYLNPLLITAGRYLPWITDTGDPLSHSAFVFIATILIACPCAMGLATPMALLSGTGIAARRGLILRNGEAIQTAGEVDILLVDKTGTLTEGRPRVTESNVDDETLAVVSAMESRSSHPLAAAIVSYAEGRGLEIMPDMNSVREIPGEGVEGEFHGHIYRAGRPSHDTPDSAETIIEVSRDGSTKGTIRLADPLKHDAAGAVSALRQMGIDTVMITGDAPGPARAAADAAGIGEIYFALRPDRKVEMVRHFQTKGKKVAMAGDGINDAAALGSADLSIAMGTGADISMNSADIIAVRGNLTSIMETIEVSRITFETIRRNLFQAFVYNAIAIPLAMAGLLHPVMAEAAMIMSSVSVITGSMAIRRKVNKTGGKKI